MNMEFSHETCHFLMTIQRNRYLTKNIMKKCILILGDHGAVGGPARTGQQGEATGTLD